MILPILAATVLISGCQSRPPSPAINSYASGGYLFLTERVSENIIRVKVPCCQTYEADDSFRQNMLIGAQSYYDCAVEDPVFADGWVGEWQLIADCTSKNLPSDQTKDSMP